MLGKTVKVIIDRPLGTYHPKHKDIYYSVNYEYIDGDLIKYNSMDKTLVNECAEIILLN